jgi:hypothetical protein
MNNHFEINEEFRIVTDDIHMAHALQNGSEILDTPG